VPSYYNNIRPNLAGDFPQIDPTALIDPSAQIIGIVKIDKDFFVGQLSVIMSDKRGPDGKVAPIHIGEEVNIQDGVVIIHTDPGAHLL
jgi:carbonic anhydrase/acetyltransferase-like protein (isoleucine patch superfamily)